MKKLLEKHCVFVFVVLVLSQIMWCSTRSDRESLCKRANYITDRADWIWQRYCTEQKQSRFEFEVCQAFYDIELSATAAEEYCR